MAFFELVNHQMVLSSNEVSEIVSALELQVRKFTNLKDVCDDIVIQDICQSRLDVLQPLFESLNKVYLNSFNYKLVSQSYE